VPGEIVRHLPTILPAGFRAAPKVHLGPSSEVDVGTYDFDSRNPDTGADSGDDGTGRLIALSPTLTVEADLSGQDEYEVRIYDSVGAGNWSPPSKSSARRAKTVRTLASFLSSRWRRCCNRAYAFRWSIW
jgi:hypothetical protein